MSGENENNILTTGAYYKPYYKGKKTYTEEESVDKIAIGLLSISSSISKYRVTFFFGENNGLQLYCQVETLFFKNDMNIKTDSFKKNSRANEWLESEFKSQSTYVYGDLIEFFLVKRYDNDYPSAIIRRIITKEMLMDFIKNTIKIPSDIIYKIEKLPTKDVYQLLVNRTLHICKGEEAQSTPDFDYLYDQFLINNGYTSIKNLIERRLRAKDAFILEGFFSGNIYFEMFKNPYIAARKFSFKKTDKIAVEAFDEPVWGKRRLGKCFIEGIINSKKSGSTVNFREDVLQETYKVVIAKSYKESEDEGYVAKKLAKTGKVSKWKRVLTDIGEKELISEIVLAVEELKEPFSKYNLNMKEDGLPEEVVNSILEEMNASGNFNKKLVYNKLTTEQNSEVINYYIDKRLDMGETFIYYNFNDKITLLSDFLLEMFILNTLVKMLENPIEKPHREEEIQNFYLAYKNLKNNFGNSIVLTEKQEEAIEGFINNDFFILTGGPGTGKTFTISIIVKLIKKLGLNFELVAPTGKAAKRISELSGETAKTIHMMLGFKGGSTFEVETLPEIDVIIIDEFSMVDTNVFSAFLSAVHSNTKIILVGDPDQLPSIAAGDLLINLINILDKYGTNSVVKLDQIMRQKEVDGKLPAIVKLSKDLMEASKTSNNNIFYKNIIGNVEGEYNYNDTLITLSKEKEKAKKGGKDNNALIPLSKEKKKVKDSVKDNNALIRYIFTSLTNENDFDIDKISNVASLSNNFGSLKDDYEFFKGFKKGEWTIITPYKKSGDGKVGSEELNKIMRPYMNGENFEPLNNWSKEKMSSAKSKIAASYYEPERFFCIGDKVLCTSNLYKTSVSFLKKEELIEMSKTLGFPVVNGDVGTVEEVYTYNENTWGEFIQSPFSELPEIYQTDKLAKMYSPFYKIRFEGKDESTWFNGRDAKGLELGYVFTIHKAQGSEYNNLFVILPLRAENFITPRMVYTALTRAKNKLYLLSATKLIEGLTDKYKKDIRYTNVEQVNLLKELSKDEEIGNLLKIYHSWVVKIRQQLYKKGLFLKPYKFILSIIKGFTVTEDSETTEEEED